MNASTTPSPAVPATDPDLAEQARPGHGVPSQDPSPDAQYALRPEEAAREAGSALVGGGAMAGAAAGAAVGVAVAGPVGVVVGGVIGGVAGALGGAAAGAAVRPGAADGPVRLHVEDGGGSGRPVVLIHGWPLSGQAWSQQTQVLQAAGCRVVVYDRRGFGRSDKPPQGYDYDTLADDLARVLDQCGLQDATLVGFSMGGGEVARYIARHGEARLRGVVFAAAVPPYLLQGPDNPEGPLTPAQAGQMKSALQADRGAFFEQFTHGFFSAHGVLQVGEEQRSEAVGLCHQSAQHAALACMDAFGGTDFREDLRRITVPTLVLHGDADAIVPIEGSGLRTHRAVAHSRLVTIAGAPHGLNVSHSEAFNDALLAFLRE
ncbi:alpha/beta fold hydrolase [Pseudorhodoferax sp.]|uniref:alpha/beta fold hydrolase n=1 Tax=Pseudorhodoferax sp. TaxID=1993553 RepID=UPI0039E54D27